MAWSKSDGEFRIIFMILLQCLNSKTIHQIGVILLYKLGSTHLNPVDWGQKNPEVCFSSEVFCILRE